MGQGWPWPDPGPTLLARGQLDPGPGPAEVGPTREGQGRGPAKVVWPWPGPAPGQCTSEPLRPSVTSLRSLCVCYSSHSGWLASSPFLPNRAPGRSVWQKQAHHLCFVMANHHLPPFLPNQALDAQFGKNGPYHLCFVNVHHHLPPFLPLTPVFPNPDMKDVTNLVMSFVSGFSLLLFYMFSTKPCIFQFNAWFSKFDLNSWNDWNELTVLNNNKNPCKVAWKWLKIT